MCTNIFPENQHATTPIKRQPRKLIKKPPTKPIIKDGVIIKAPRLWLLENFQTLTTEKPGIINFHKVDDKVYRGASLENEASFDELKKDGFTDFIDLRGRNTTPLSNFKYEEYHAEKRDMRYHHFEQRSTTIPTIENVKRFFKIIANAKGKVYVHCKSGIDRTGSFIALYLILIYHFTCKQAVKFMEKCGLNFVHKLAPQKIHKRFIADTTQVFSFLDNLNLSSIKKADLSPLLKKTELLHIEKTELSPLLKKISQEVK